LPRLDGRTVSARRYRQLVESFESEIGNNLSAADVSLVRQAASLTLAAEALQADIGAGKPVDTDALVRVSSEARRVLGMLHSKADKAKPAGQTLADYIAQKYAKADGGAA
jgi:hypothetical protein